MYINDVIKLAKSYYPSEYDEKEMYSWCDEVSSMLAVMDRTVYASATVVPDENGSILLPEGVDFESVVSITVGDTVMTKENMRRIDERRIKTDSRVSVNMVYVMPYVPIRTSEYIGTVKFDNLNNRIYLKNNPFFKGDYISLRVNEAYLCDLLVLDSGVDSTSELENYLVVGGELPDVSDTEATLTRIITDKTACNAPYDRMYIDFILAKIGMYQRDYEMYNQYMTVFNSRLSAYKKWLINHLPQDKYKLTNWW